MNCPYCGKEMECGELVSSHALFWFNEHTSGDSPNSISLTDTSFKAFLKALSENYFLEGHRCPDCKKIILTHK